MRDTALPYKGVRTYSFTYEHPSLLILYTCTYSHGGSQHTYTFSTIECREHRLRTTDIKNGIQYAII